MQCSIFGSRPIRNLHDTITRLARLRSSGRIQPAAPATARLTPLRPSGSNPGDLAAFSYVPEGLSPGSPLVVVLHGCTQSAAGYDASAGWSKLAEENGFALLFPEQKRANNPNLCFNWFSAGDTQRGRGEVHSIRQMVAAMVEAHAIDSARIFVTGLSAGGAMAAAMLATYPDVFAGGAVIAGLPFGTAQSMPEAFDRMRGHGGPAEEELTELVRDASNHRGPWPTLAVWHGDDDRTVDPSNASALVEQWRALHGASAAPTRSDRVENHEHRVWTDPAGRAVIEEYRIRGFPHGTPLDTDRPEEVAGPHMFDAGISSTRLIAQFWGLSGGKGAKAAVPTAAPAISRGQAKADTDSVRRPRPAPPPYPAIGKTIEDALRAAGLMR